MKKFSLVLATLACSSSLMAGVLATYKGGEITTDDVAPQLAKFKIHDINALPKEAKEGLIKDAAARKLLAAEGKKLKLNKTDEYKSALAAIEQSMLAQAYLAKLAEKITVSEDEIKKHYNEHLADFKVPEAVKTAHILLEDEKAAKAVVKELKGLKGDALKKKFAELAAAKSKDPGSAKAGGELPMMNATQLVPEYFNAARGLKVGQVSNPVKSQFGFHVILLQAHDAERQGSLSEARPFIENGLKQEKQLQLIVNESKKLVDAAGLVIK